MGRRSTAASAGHSGGAGSHTNGTNSHINSHSHANSGSDLAQQQLLILEADPAHCDFLAKSLGRNDTEYAALEKLHSQLHHLRKLIVELHDGNESALFPDFEFDSLKNHDNVAAGISEEDTSADDNNSTSNQKELKILLQAFRVRLQLRRRLLNRLCRRLNRVAHYMDGETTNVVPPACPRYGDIPFQFRNAAGEVLDDTHQTQSPSADRLAHIKSFTLEQIRAKATRQKVRTLRQSLPSDEARYRLDALVTSIVGDKNANKAAQNKTKATDASLSSAEQTLTLQQQQDKALKAFGLTREEMEHLKDHDVGYDKMATVTTVTKTRRTTTAGSGGADNGGNGTDLVASNGNIKTSTNVSKSTSTSTVIKPVSGDENDDDEDNNIDPPDYTKISRGNPGIGATARSSAMPQKEKQTEHARWVQEILQIVIEQPTFDELGMGLQDPANLFLGEQRRRRVMMASTSASDDSDSGNEMPPPEETTSSSSTAVKEEEDEEKDTDDSMMVEEEEEGTDSAAKPEEEKEDNTEEKEDNTEEMADEEMADEEEKTQTIANNEKDPGMDMDSSVDAAATVAGKEEKDSSKDAAVAHAPSFSNVNANVDKAEPAASVDTKAQPVMQNDSAQTTTKSKVVKTVTTTDTPKIGATPDAVVDPKSTVADAIIPKPTTALGTEKEQKKAAIESKVADEPVPATVAASNVLASAAAAKSFVEPTKTEVALGGAAPPVVTKSGDAATATAMDATGTINTTGSTATSSASTQPAVAPTPTGLKKEGEANVGADGKTPEEKSNIKTGTGATIAAAATPTGSTTIAASDGAGAPAEQGSSAPKLATEKGGTLAPAAATGSTTTSAAAPTTMADDETKDLNTSTSKSNEAAPVASKTKATDVVAAAAKEETKKVKTNTDAVPKKEILAPYRATARLPTSTISSSMTVMQGGIQWGAPQPSVDASIVKWGSFKVVESSMPPVMPTAKTTPPVSKEDEKASLSLVVPEKQESTGVNSGISSTNALGPKETKTEVATAQGKDQLKTDVDSSPAPKSVSESVTTAAPEKGKEATMEEKISSTEAETKDEAPAEHETTPALESKGEAKTEDKDEEQKQDEALDKDVDMDMDSSSKGKEEALKEPTDKKATDGTIKDTAAAVVKDDTVMEESDTEAEANVTADQDSSKMDVDESDDEEEEADSDKDSEEEEESKTESASDKDGSGSDEEEEDESDDEDDDEEKKEEEKAAESSGASPNKKDSKRKHNFAIVSALQKKKARLSLQPVPSFALQDLKRIKAIQAQLIQASVQDLARKRVDEATAEYNATVKKSTELQGLKIRLQQEQQKSGTTARNKAQKLRNEFALEVAIARSKWTRQKEDWQAAKKARLYIRLQGRRSQNGYGLASLEGFRDPCNPYERNVSAKSAVLQSYQGLMSSVEQRVMSTGARRATTFTAMDASSEVAKFIGRTGQNQTYPTLATTPQFPFDVDMNLPTFPVFKAPSAPPEIDPAYLVKKQEETQAMMTKQIRVVEDKFAASEEERKRAWRKLQKLKNEYEHGSSGGGGTPQSSQPSQSRNTSSNRSSSQHASTPSSSSAQPQTKARSSAAGTAGRSSGRSSRTPASRATAGAGSTKAASTANRASNSTSARTPSAPITSAQHRTTSPHVQPASSAGSSPSRPQPTSAIVGGAGGAAATAPSAYDGQGQSVGPGTGEGGTDQHGNKYAGKYTVEKVRERIFPDGSVKPVTMPKKDEKGLYYRPAGRQRKGMDWDAVNGRWIPIPGQETRTAQVQIGMYVPAHISPSSQQQQHQAAAAPAGMNTGINMGMGMNNGAPAGSLGAPGNGSGPQ